MNDAAPSRPAGQVARLLAASKPGGVFLCLGEAGAALGPPIIDGMDMSARLVAVVEDPRAASALEQDMDGDLRVTVHSQACAAFLEDVRDHRFDLIAAPAPDDPAVAALALERLAPGGLFLTDEVAAAEGTARAAGEFTVAVLPGAPGITLVVRGPERRQPRRRGGRRSRQGVTSIFTTKGRGRRA